MILLEINVRLVSTLSCINRRMSALEMTPFNKAGHVKIQGLGQLIWQPILMLLSPAGNPQGMVLGQLQLIAPRVMLCTKYLGTWVGN